MSSIDFGCHETRQKVDNHRAVNRWLNFGKQGFNYLTIRLREMCKNRANAFRSLKLASRWLWYFLKQIMPETMNCLWFQRLKIEQNRFLHHCHDKMIRQKYKPKNSPIDLIFYLQYTNYFLNKTSSPVQLAGWFFALKQIENILYERIFLQNSNFATSIWFNSKVHKFVSEHNFSHVFLESWLFALQKNENIP